MQFFLKISTVLFLASIFCGCTISTSGTYKNEQIEAGTRQEIKKMNDRFMHALMANDFAKVRSFISDFTLKKTSKEETYRLLRQLKEGLATKKYRVMDEYYVSNLNSDVTNVIPSGRTDDGAYEISYKALNKEMYTSLLMPEGLENDILILLVYGKKGTEWKINIMYFGQFDFLGKTAPDYYKLAKKSYERSELIDAVDYILAAKKCLKPGGEFFSYKKEKEINDFHDKVLKEANEKYKLPKVLKQIDTRPELFLITPELLEDGIYPLVCYVSQIDLESTEALTKENNLVKKEVNKLFTGINKNKKRVLYRVYNEKPDGKKELRYYGFIDELK